MESWESPQGSFSGEEFKSTLRIPDFFDTQKPYKEVEPVHKKSSKIRALWKKDKKLDGFIYVMREAFQQSWLIGQ